VAQVLDGRSMITMAITINTDGDHHFTLVYDKVIVSFDEYGYGRRSSMVMILRDLNNEMRFWGELKHIIKFSATISGQPTGETFRHDYKARDTWVGQYERDARVESLKEKGRRATRAAAKSGVDDGKAEVGENDGFKPTMLTYELDTTRKNEPYFPKEGKDKS
jgi:hypothetical protein